MKKSKAKASDYTSFIFFSDVVELKVDSIVFDVKN